MVMAAADPSTELARRLLAGALAELEAARDALRSVAEVVAWEAPAAARFGEAARAQLAVADALARDAAWAAGGIGSIGLDPLAAAGWGAG